MNYIENIYICLAAPILVAIMCLRNEGRRSLSFVLAGMTSCLLSAYVSTFLAGVTGIAQQAAAYEIAPVVEEIMKGMPILFFILIFEPDRRVVIIGTLKVSIGFATFENVCFLTSYGTSDFMRLMIRGFGTGAMHVVCGMIVAIGLYYLWDHIWLRVVGAFALLCFVITFHAIFNIFVNQNGTIFWIGALIPMAVVITYLAFFRRKINMS